LFNDNKNSNSKLQLSVTEMLKKFEKGSGKGNVSENVVYNILLSLFPCAQIDYVGNEIKETGDIILIRNNKPKILIENKDHDSCNVPKQDIDKFIRDCEIQKCCGIMFAQNRGIANKENFEIQINNGNILLYVHNVKFDSDKIKTSIEIVEQFKIKFDEINIDNDICTIDTSTLEEINKEFNNYTTQKHSLLKLVKEFTDKINASIAELKMPNLEQFLSKHYATSSNQGENVCKYCEKFVPKSLSQHYRYCSDKKAFDDALVQKQNEKITPIDDLNLCIQDKPTRSHKKK
jgi:predicted transcriptional regulator